MHLLAFEFVNGFTKRHHIGNARIDKVAGFYHVFAMVVEPDKRCRRENAAEQGAFTVAVIIGAGIACPVPDAICSAPDNLGGARLAQRVKPEFQAFFDGFFMVVQICKARDEGGFNAFAYAQVIGVGVCKRL